MLSDRERRTLAGIERHLVESDPDLARLFAGAPPRDDRLAPPFLLVVGLVLLVLGSITAVVPVAAAGMALSVAALVLANARPARLRRPGIA